MESEHHGPDEDPAAAEGILQARVRELEALHLSSAISERKINALLQAVYRVPVERGNLKGAVFYQVRPKTLLGGDFFWGIRTKRGAAIIVGDASGHDAYAALLSVIIGLVLRSNYRNDRQRTKRLQSAHDLMAHLAQRFIDLMSRAEANYLDQTPDSDAKPWASMSKDGFDAACVVVNKDKIEIVSAGLPVYAVGFDGTLEQIGSWNPAKGIAANTDLKALGFSVIEMKRRLVRYLVTFSDGAVNQLDALRKRFGDDALEHRIKASAGPNSTAQELLDAIVDAVDAHRGDAQRTDDRIVVVIDIEKI
jgi:hypothetical protein